MKRAKLLFYLSNAYPLFAKTKHRFGGAEINMYYISREFSVRGYDVEFLVGDYGQNDIEQCDGVCIKKIKYLDVKKYKRLKHKVLRRYNFLKLLWKSEADVCILTTASEMSGYIVFVAGLKNKKTIFRVAHDWDVDKSFSTLNNLKGYMYHYALPRFDAIVSQTNAQQKILFENERLKSKVISGGFPLSYKHDVVDKNIVLWVGRDDPVKRPLLFVELAKRLNDIQFIMIMQGSSQLKETVKNEVKRASNIEFIDHVGFFDVQGYFDRAMCLVNTSKKEGFPNTFIQAGIGSTPILSYNVDPDNIIVNNNLGLVCNGDVEMAVKFITSLNAGLLEKYGSNVFKYVKLKHDIHEKTDDYERIVRELV